MRYRLLEEGEIVKAEDEFFNLISHVWSKIDRSYSGITIGAHYTNNLAPIRRPIEEPKTRFCKSCHCESQEWAKFCQNCGKEFAKPNYRLLREGEKLRIGDELLNNEQKWVKTTFPDETVGIHPAIAIYRRKISSFTD